MKLLCLLNQNKILMAKMILSMQSKEDIINLDRFKNPLKNLSADIHDRQTRQEDGYSVTIE